MEAVWIFLSAKTGGGHAGDGTVHRCVNRMVGCLAVQTDADRWRLGMSLARPIQEEGHPVQHEQFAPTDLEVTEVRASTPVTLLPVSPALRPLTRHADDHGPCGLARLFPTRQTGWWCCWAHGPPSPP